MAKALEALKPDPSHRYVTYKRYTYSNTNHFPQVADEDWAFVVYTRPELGMFK
jgi:hypothetical protein